MQCVLHVLNLICAFLRSIVRPCFFARCCDSFRRKFLLARFLALSSAFVLIILTSDLTAWYGNRTRSETRPEHV